jgi:RNA polymerase-binding transcription factor DksA
MGGGGLSCKHKEASMFIKQNAAVERPVTTTHMHYFTLEQRDALQRLLRERETVLREEIGEDRLADLDREPEAAALERDVAELREVERALARLHSPEFGICADCGADIPYARLHAQPSAVRCLACQNAAER